MLNRCGKDYPATVFKAALMDGEHFARKGNYTWVLKI